MLSRKGKLILSSIFWILNSHFFNSPPLEGCPSKRGGLTEKIEFKVFFGILPSPRLLPHLPAQALDRLHQIFHMLHRGVRQNPMPEIKDITAPGIHLLQNLLHALANMGRF